MRKDFIWFRRSKTEKPRYQTPQRGRETTGLLILLSAFKDIFRCALPFAFPVRQKISNIIWLLLFYQMRKRIQAVLACVK